MAKNSPNDVVPPTTEMLESADDTSRGEKKMKKENTESKSYDLAGL